MNEGHVGLDKADLAEQARQIESEGVVYSAEPVMGCEQLLDSRVAGGCGNRKQSSKVDFEADDDATRLRYRGHFAKRVERTNEVAKKEPTVDYIEMIARQAGTVGACMDEMNIAVTIDFGMVSRDGELVGAGIDRGDLALWPHTAC